jgi:hypothetical protein
MTLPDCPHGFPKDRMTKTGLPLCPHCRRDEVRRRRFPDHAAYDAKAAAANDSDLFEEDDQ